MNNPPVNGLRAAQRHRRRPRSGPVRRQGFKAVVLIGTAKAFSGGADIREFNSPKALAEPNLQYRDPHRRGVRQARHRRHRRRLHGRRPRAGARLPLPRRRGRGADRPAGSEARHPARRRRHAAPAAPARAGGGAQHDRLRHHRAFRAAEGHAAVRRIHRRRPAGRRAGLRRKGGEGEAAAEARARPEDRLPERRRLLPVRPQHRRRHCEELPGAFEVRRRRRGRRDQALRRGHEDRARGLRPSGADAGIEGPAPRLLRRARRLEDRRRAGRHAGTRKIEPRSASSAPAPWAAASP
jgi:hypothetical protein